MKNIKKYQNIYQVVHEFQELDGEISFSENLEDNYIKLKKGQIYRFDKNILILKFDYSTLNCSIKDVIKSPFNELYEELKSKITILDTDYFDDCLLVRFKEESLSIVMEILGNKHGCYKSRLKRSSKSIKNLPNYEAKRKVLEEIQNTKQHNKLIKLIDKAAEKSGKSKLITWRNIYKKFKDQYNIDISELSNISEIKPINIIDSQNLYSKMFKILESEV